MLPEGFEARMCALLGSEYEDFLASFDRPLCTGLRRNPLKTGFTGDLSRFSLSPVPWCPTGFYYDAVSRPGLSPYHAAGLYYLQEPSAMAPADLLDPQPGERVLDLCAAPGGKSTQLAGKLRGKGLLVCNEINAKRAKILSGNIERLGISNALVLNEHPKRLEERFAGYFDKILVDAPCSGEGMFRKEPAALEHWSEENIRLCAARGREILDAAAAMVRPGGRLVFSTCTFAPEENECQIAAFLMRHPEFELVDPGVSFGRPSLSRISGAWVEVLRKNLSRTGCSQWAMLPSVQSGTRTCFTSCLARMRNCSLTMRGDGNRPPLKQSRRTVPAPTVSAPVRYCTVPTSRRRRSWLCGK